jgi:hypothetical protein
MSWHNSATEAVMADAFTEGLRLTILRLVNECTGRSANESVLHSSLPILGFAVSRDRVRTELMWLEEQGAIQVGRFDRPGDTALLIAQGTLRTDDIVNDRARVAGIARPNAQG